MLGGGWNRGNVSVLAELGEELGKEKHCAWQLEFIVFKYIFNIYIWITFIGKIWKENKKLDCVCLAVREVWGKDSTESLLYTFVICYSC
ncbi:hypothetical protein llap_11954 [Limosa lapponica baueri]|uniref:Uncharacterized protein n=1 Tax=Limosa lapponica baueri TaxID=1758121 RepID=A0A2I0TVD6_LIMLA|nr:hypothetical protein llap_11954 [Limosa lapponica baueri]